MLAACLLVPVDQPEARPKASAMAVAPAQQVGRHMQFEPGLLLDYKRIRLPSLYRAKGWRILYWTRDFRQRPILSSGVVILPDSAPRIPMERKFVAWAHPTGVARKCAPSLRQSPTKAIDGIDRMVSAGLVIAATDYPGLGTEGPVGYLVGKGQAYAVIDSVRAARQIPGVGGGNQYALWGYSQGGHAVLFAADESARYAPELKLAGAAAVAPPTDLTRLLRATISSVEGRVLAAMALASWSRKYDAPLTGLVDAGVQRVIDHVNSYCVDDLGEKFDILAAQKPLQQRFLNFDPGSRRPWSTMLSENSRFQPASRVPLYIAQGSSDELVRPEVTLSYVRAACRQGVSVTYVALRGKGHGGSIDAAKADAVKWIAARLSGRPATSNCR
jgi:alpha-beta hydrolase superfamily lysophospholipase